LENTIVNGLFNNNNPFNAPTNISVTSSYINQFNIKAGSGQTSILKNIDMNIIFDCYPNNGVGVGTGGTILVSNCIFLNNGVKLIPSSNPNQNPRYRSCYVGNVFHLENLPYDYLSVTYCNLDRTPADLREDEGNITDLANALFNNVSLNDFTNRVDTIHFRNGGANQSANIGNARLGIPTYKGDTSITNTIYTLTEDCKVVGTTITLTSSITAKNGDTITISGTTSYNGTYTCTADSTGNTITIVDSGLTDNGLESGTIKVVGTRLVSEVADTDQLGTWDESDPEFFSNTIDLRGKLGASIFTEGLYLPGATEVDPTFYHYNKESNGDLILY